MTNGVSAEKFIIERMRKIGMPPLAIESFLRQYGKLAQGFTGFLDRTMIEPLDNLPEADALENYRDAGLAALDRTLILKLNGGLGTSMGLDRTKSLLMVKNGLTFLDVVIGQVERLRKQTGSRIPLVLMNSFNTDDETRAALAKCQGCSRSLSFNTKSRKSGRTTSCRSTGRPTGPASGARRARRYLPGARDLGELGQASGARIRIRVCLQHRQSRRDDRPADPGLFRGRTRSRS